MWRTTLSLVAALWMAGPAAASVCRDLTHEGQDYTVCEVTAGADLRLFHTAPDGRPYGNFARVDHVLEGEGKALVFAMNAGMYHPDLAPVGLLVEGGTTRAPLVTADGPGNFGLLPNGVFCIGEGRFAVVETRTFAASRRACAYATQSGPMLVIGGNLHPRFLPNSDSRFVRNGVGVSADGQSAVFAISARPVTFHQFARLFRDGLALPDALYFDGQISRLYALEIGRNDWGFAMGPIVGLVGDPGGAGG